jgi:hypothetical protein
VGSTCEECGRTGKLAMSIQFTLWGTCSASLGSEHCEAGGARVKVRRGL